MINCQPIIGVKDVEASSKWYQQLLGCAGMHGGDEFEMLADERKNVFLCLHKWEAHEHPTISDPTIPVGNGLILFFHVNDRDELKAAFTRAEQLGAAVEEPIHENPNSRMHQFCLRDPDNYYLIITERFEG